MLTGTTLYKMGGADAHTPEFPRGGLSAVFGFEVLDVVGSPNLTVAIQNRNEDETSFTAVDDFALITAAGTFTKEVSSLKEIIRLKLSFAGGDASTVGVRFLIPAPMWMP